MNLSKTGKAPHNIGSINIENNLSLLYLTISPELNSGTFRIKKEMNRSIVSNIAIYHVDKDIKSLLFEKSEKRKLHSFIYESKYDAEYKRLEFNRNESNIINNKDIEQRSLANTLFVVTSDYEDTNFEFWTFDKMGGSQKLIQKFTEYNSWKIDVKNKKILFISKVPNDVNIEVFDW